jgi:hypothetical protein
MQLLVSRWFDQFAVGSAHRRTPRSIRAVARRLRRILKRNEMRARQEKPVRLSSILRVPRSAERSCGHRYVTRAGGTHGDGYDPAAVCGAVWLRESLLQTRQTALDVNRPSTPNRSYLCGVLSEHGTQYAKGRLLTVLLLNIFKSPILN